MRREQRDDRAADDEPDQRAGDLGAHALAEHARSRRRPARSTGATGLMVLEARGTTPTNGDERRTTPVGPVPKIELHLAQRRCGRRCRQGTRRLPEPRAGRRSIPRAGSPAATSVTPAMRATIAYVSASGARPAASVTPLTKIGAIVESAPTEMIAVRAEERERDRTGRECVEAGLGGIEARCAVANCSGIAMAASVRPAMRSAASHDGWKPRNVAKNEPGEAVRLIRHATPSDICAASRARRPIGSGYGQPQVLHRRRDDL